MQIEMSDFEVGSLKTEYWVFVGPSGLGMCVHKKGIEK